MSVFAGIPAEPRDAALEYARRGLSIFPCSPHTKRPLVKGGFKSATADPAQVETWWAQHPQALIGLPTGAVNGVWALDVDAKAVAETGDSVEDVLEQLEMECDCRFRGPRVDTLRHGRHVYFAHDARVRIGAGRFRPGVDWRGEGGYVIAPDNCRYLLLSDGELEPAPEPLIFRIVAAQGATSAGNSLTQPSTGLVIPFQPGLREWVASAVREGSRHDGMVRVVWHLVASGLPAADILAMAPLFPQPEAEFRTAVAGAFAKQEKDPAGAAAVSAQQYGERLEARAFDPAAIAALTPREWLYGHLAIRKFVSVIGAPGGVGKTAYATTVALALATGRPLLGEVVHKRSRVWLYNLEDPLDEQYRRLEAAMKLHHVHADDLKGWLYVASGRDQRLCMAIQTKEGPAALTPHVDMMSEEIKARGIDVLFVDPFVKSHALNENDNIQIDAAATAWAEVGERTNCAPILVHHFRKGGTGDADSFRGASALVDAARCAVSLSPMSEQEAESLNVENRERLQLVRVDNAKLNLAPRPEFTKWLELVGVTIHTGDNVQAAREWAPPSVFHGLNAQQVNELLDQIAEGFQDDFPWSPDKQAKERWVVNCVVTYCVTRGIQKTEGQGALMVAAWLESGVLEIINFKRPTDRREAKGLAVIDHKRPSAASWDME